MGKLGRVAVLYLIASAATPGPGFALSHLARVWFDLGWNAWDVSVAIWLVTVGGPSLSAASEFLARSLGARSPVTVAVRGIRAIPIAGGRVVADAVRLAAPGLRPEVRPVAEVPRGLIFRRDGALVEESDLRYFLAGAWRRQRRGEAPLARTYWVDGGRLDRPMYELAVDVLVAHHMLFGERRQGSKNRLRYPPETALHELRFSYFRVGWVPVLGIPGTFGRVGRLGRPG